MYSYAEGVLSDYVGYKLKRGRYRVKVAAKLLRLERQVGRIPSPQQDSS